MLAVHATSIDQNDPLAGVIVGQRPDTADRQRETAVRAKVSAFNGHSVVCSPGWLGDDGRCHCYPHRHQGTGGLHRMS